MDYLMQAKKLESYLSSIREDLHRHPELGNREVYTSAKLEGILKDLGLDVRRILDTALVATLHGKDTGRKVALRADMDALPVEEATDCRFKSGNAGVMHACGHDIHMTAAVGAARLLSQNRENLEGDVVFLFQPDEEGYGGAQRMIDAGALDGVSAVFGGHVAPDLPLGTVGIRYGKFYAASIMFTITVHGKSCHGARPEEGIDALNTAARISAQIIDLKPSSGDKAVVTVGKFTSGSACNIISDKAVLEGIVRTLGKDDRKEMMDSIRTAVSGICKETGAKADVDFYISYGGVVNTDAETKVMEESARQVLGDGKVRILKEPTMTTEDFGFFIDASSGSFCHIGAGCTEPLHSPHFLPDGQAAITAAAVYAQCLDNYLKKN